MNINLVDGTAFHNAEVKRVDTFTYSRKYTSVQWVTTVLPVALSYSDWSSKFEIADITDVNVQLDNNGNLQSFNVIKTILKSGDTTVPNKPYLIRAKTANSSTAQIIKKTNCDVYPSISTDNVIIKGNYKFTFKGLYEKMDAALMNNKYYSSKENWIKSTGSTTVGSFRVILDVTKEEQQEPINTSTISYENLVEGNSQEIGKLIIDGKEVFVIKVPVVSGSSSDLEQRVKKLEDALDNLLFRVVKITN